ncbi:MAG: aminotransferase class V-fold PLP-dependent enzyme [Jaaginema sp. PMC 1079.18]|nr:aminotransferase class V-fold PLP-dependent enzyme [Jaaginema sp. PMC 1080.18]MEC4849528.1 aminotransferase class V-fold PLP-dependent enzyme [Jaaginema sp. PMC 1079.18]MEC4865720.1 aminotransferase class V-fold PLP-dependent enzyme [Jaaginema sp. PMC 1078.18]
MGISRLMQKTYPRLRLDISTSDLMAGLGFLGLGNHREAEINAIQEFWQKEVLIALSVRTGFDLLLQAWHFPPGSQVLMSGINIENMFAIVQAHNLIPVGVDLDFETLAPNLKDFAAKINENTCLCVITHLFGSIVPLDTYAKICQQWGVMLVEDCAQGFTGKRYLGHSEADVSLFSFGPIKSATALGGAVVWVKDETLRQKMQGIEAQYEFKTRFWYGKRLLKYVVLKFLSQPWIYDKLLLILEQMGQDSDRAIASLARGFAAGELLPKLRYRPPSPMIALLRRRLRSRWDSQGRQKTAQMFLSCLNNAVLIPGQQTEYHSFWLVAIATHNPTQSIVKLRQNGFDATQGATSLRAMSNCPIAKQILDQILYLPISPFMPESTLLRLAEIINHYTLAAVPIFKES